jgi:hypothetical protein
VSSTPDHLSSQNQSSPSSESVQAWQEFASWHSPSLAASSPSSSLVNCGHCRRQRPAASLVISPAWASSLGSAWTTTRRPDGQGRAGGSPPPGRAHRHRRAHSVLLLLAGAVPLGGAGDGPLVARPGASLGRRGRGHACAGARSPHAHQRVRGCRRGAIRRDRRQADVDRRPPRNAEARVRAACVDGLPPAYRSATRSPTPESTGRRSGTARRSPTCTN